jgi:hypothetical protein
MPRLADDLVVIIVGPDPDPHDTVFDLSAESSVMRANSDRPQLAKSFEMQGRVLRIALEQKIVLVCKSSDLLGEGIV